MLSFSINIAVTGFPGAGKSFFLKNLIKDSKNSKIIDCDKIGHKLLQTEKVISFVEYTFGSEFIEIKDNKKIINRKKLADKIFNNSYDYTIYQKFISRLMIHEIQLEMERNNNYNYLFIDAALIFEWGIDFIFSDVIYINAPDKVRYKHLNLRNEDIENYKKRETFLIDKKIKKNRSTIIIFNSGDISNEIINKTKYILEDKYGRKL